jgi:hypothetical protein
MKRSLKTTQRSSLTLGDLVIAVSSSARTSREVAAALEDLFERRRVVLRGAKRVQIVM